MKRLSLITLFFLSCLCLEVGALEERVEDISASVEVASCFSLSLDKPQLEFGQIKPAETKILGEGRFFNEVRCRSNYGRTWFLKAHLLSSGLKFAEGDYRLPVSALKWRIVSARSEAEPLGEFQFQEFSSEPALIYISQGDDSRGKEVVLRFQYSLSSPDDAPAGVYSGSIIFTMSEAP